MTLLISMLADDEITVVMDTFAAGAPVGTHDTKFWAPASGTFIAAGTGIAQVVQPWLAAIAAGPDRSPDQVIDEAETMLPQLWHEAGEQHGADQLGPTTAWTYFFDSAGRATRVSVSSRSNFARETETRHGTMIRPEVPVGGFGSFDGSDAALLRLARYVARYCTEQPEHGVAVGGRAMMIRLSRFGAAVTRTLGHLS
ncbi:hypothetical protein ACWEVD_23525 [Nocardia thailandica]